MNNSEIKKFRLGELFCGPGGLALAAVTAKISNPEYKIVHQWANDYDMRYVIPIVEIYARIMKKV